jgi:putative transposase
VGHAKAYVLTDPVRAHGEAHGGGEGEVCGRPGGGGKGGLRVFFLDESGFGLSLPPTYAWARKGEAVRVPRAWGKSGRVNAVAHLERRSCGGWGLGYALPEGRCETGAYPSRYSPHLNPVETIWRRVKGFLMPRRHYRSVEELRGAVAAAMERLREGLGQGVLQGLCIGT